VGNTISSWNANSNWAKTLATLGLDVKNRKNDSNSRNHSNTRESWDHQGTPTTTGGNGMSITACKYIGNSRDANNVGNTNTTDETSTAVWTAAIAVIIAPPRIPFQRRQQQ
jgi:hypothetical protein